MIRLDRITMQGFKSFAGKITIPFPKGFNCICGPNGSGKSNIIDALTFVLGTSSARAIRAQRLQNLLFNGARDKKPADFCEVTLYLENDGSIAGYESEIKVSRRVNRSGVTFYKLNGRTVTRSKILDLLANANLSPEGYNIIMQGDVTKIIEMNPKERRGIIDEVSGIAEFDDKKEKAQREMERVEMRVRENMIVVAEKQKLVARMKQERESAEKYKKLGDELRKSRASMLNRKMKDIEEKLSVTEKEDRESDERLAAIDKDLKKAEKDLRENEDLLKKMNEDILKKSRNIEIMRKIDALQTEIIRKKDKIDLNERQASMLRSTERNEAVKDILSGNFSGVHGTFSSLVSTDRKYETALEVAVGRHDKDIVVDDEDIASGCINHLKKRKIGRARFLPLRKLQKRERREYRGREKVIGYLIDFVKYDGRFSSAVKHVLESVLVADNIDTAKRISGFKVVTLEGDLVEPSGEMIGGYYKRKMKDVGFHEIKKLEEENLGLENEITKIEKELAVLKSQEQSESKEVMKLQERKNNVEKAVEDLRKKWKDALEEKIALQGGVSKGKIERARLEASYDNLKVEAEEFSEIKEYYSRSVDELQERVRSLTLEINKLGPVNLRALEEYDVIITEFEELKKKLDKLINEKEAVMKVVEEVSKRRYEKFMETFGEINKNLTQIYHDLAGGAAGLRLEEENNIDSGLIIEASPPGKRVLNLDSMSGGERTLTSLAFLFAIMQHYSSPFYVLDEVDAALDKSNTKKIADLIKKYSGKVQFIVITHNDLTISEADKVFGVSIEGGVSKVFGIEMPQEQPA
ncbi:MAG: chromosome segregation protein SMC [Candidatus Aenigmarchaeota archaeon]|nr:chromosome segregation protein SMC [Candidatus Aenigmarchaeota archaeon]